MHNRKTTRKPYLKLGKRKKPTTKLSSDYSMCITTLTRVTVCLHALYTHANQKLIAIQSVQHKRGVWGEDGRRMLQAAEVPWEVKLLAGVSVTRDRITIWKPEGRLAQNMQQCSRTVRETPSQQRGKKRNASSKLSCKLFPSTHRPRPKYACTHSHAPREKVWTDVDRYGQY